MPTYHYVATPALMLIALILTVVITPATASEVYTGLGFEPNDQQGHTKVGIGIGVKPTYEGADDVAAFAAPLINISTPGAYFLNGVSLNPNDGLFSGGVTLFHAGFKGDNTQGVRITLGPYFRAHPGREQDEDDKLLGLRDIDASVGVGLFLNIRNARWAMQLVAAPHDVTDNADDGVLASLDILYSVLRNPGWTLDAGATGSWANDEYMQAYYGVSAAQSGASGYSVYNAEAGMKDLGIYLKGDYQFISNWNMHAELGYWQLQGDAKNSPIVESGSENQIRFLLGATYRF